MKARYYGHGCFGFEIEATKFLIDPFITQNELAKSVDINKIEADYILLTHGHEDHVADTEVIYKNTNATLIANFEVANWFQKKGVKDSIGMNIGGALQLEGCAIKMVSALHSSSMPDGSYGGLAAGFIFVFEEDEVEKLFILQEIRDFIRKWN